MRVAYIFEHCWHEVPGGTAVASNELARRLAEHHEVEVVGVAGRHRADPVAGFEPPVPVAQLPLARPWLYEAWNRVERPRVESATGPIDLCHSPIAIPASTRGPQVVTIHDVAFVHAPERFSRHGVRVMTAGLERCRRADRIISPSRTTMGHLVELGFDAERIAVVPWGIDPTRATDEEVDRVRDLYGLPDRFVLSVGTVEPRKNGARLVEAVRRLDDAPDLVAVGAAGWSGLPEGVRALGFVPWADLRGLYAAATVLAYPSLEEGFGLPVAEAMAQGTAVVTSAGTSTEEVADGAAVLVDPTDVDSIRDGLDAALTDPESLAAPGLRRAAALSWDAAVDATVSVYREVLS